MEYSAGITSLLILIIIGLIVARWGITIWKYLTLFVFLIGLCVSAGVIHFLIDRRIIEWNQHEYIIGIIVGITLLLVLSITIIKILVKFTILSTIAGGVAYLLYGVTNEEKVPLIGGLIALVVAFILFDKVLKLLFAILGGLLSSLGSFLTLSKYTNMRGTMIIILSSLAFVVTLFIAFAGGKKKGDAKKGKGSIINQGGKK